jgi:membrane fusion protein, heavy metal efflux system
MLMRRRFYVVIGTAGVLAVGALATRHVLSPAVANPTQAVAAGVAVAAAAPAPNAVDVSPEALSNMDLHFAKAELRPLVRTVRVTGIVNFNALRLAQISPASRGRIEAIDVAVGQRVRAGQRLAILDAFDLSEVRSQVASAHAAVTDAAATAAAAEAALTRATNLIGVGGIAQSEVDRRRAALASAQAMLRTHQAELQKWQGMEQRLMPTGPLATGGGKVALAQAGPADSLGAVVAPIAGIVNSVGAAPGDIVDTSRQIFTVADLSTLWVQANVPEHDLGAIQEGDSVTMSVDAYPGRQFTGRVTYIADQVDPNTGTVAVRCEIPNPDGALRVNMFATLDIAAPLNRNAVLVPDAALQDVNGQTTVFIPTGTGRFTGHVVRTGVSSGGFTEVVEGVTADTRVVTDGSYWLKAALLQNSIPDEG